MAMECEDVPAETSIQEDTPIAARRADALERIADHYLTSGESRHHHHLVHEGGYGLAMPVGGEPVFSAPNGSLIPGGPDTRFRGNVFALTTGNPRERVEIRARTAVPYWSGERMDDGMAVEGLVRRELSVKGQHA